MKKNILYSVLLIVFALGLHGCSCSPVSKNTDNAAPGLYLSQFSVFEGNSGAKVSVNFSVTLQRENSDEITVAYAVLAIDPTGRTAEEIADFAVVDDADNSGPNTDVIATSGTITFAAGGSDEIQASLDLIGDTVYERNEIFQIVLSAASAGVTIVDGSIEAVIKNDDAVPVVTMAADKTSIAEVFDGGFLGGTTSVALNNADLIFTLDRPSGVDTKLSLSTQMLQGAAVGNADFRIDYFFVQGGTTLYLNDPVVIPAGDTTAVVTVAVVDDGVAEGDEGFQLTLLDPIDATLDTAVGANKIQFTLADNDSGIATKISKVNDTGLIELISVSAGLTPAQNDETDAKKGLDNTLPIADDGRVGFDYTRYDTSGAETTAVFAYGDTMVPWECVKDNVSGLVWEVKALSGVRSSAHKYTWYDPNTATNGGDRGEQGNDICVAGSSLLNECNTAYYAADVNQTKLCGMTGWRLPTIDELRTLVDYGIESGPGVGQRVVSYDTDYFAADVTGANFTWSSTTDAQSTSRARTMRFLTPSSEESRDKGNPTFHVIRLVNDSLLTSQQP